MGAAGGVTNPAAVGAAAAGLLVTLANGAVVPADTPAIAAAKAKFRAAGGNTNPAIGGSGTYAGPYASTGAAYAGPLAAPAPLVTLSNGAKVPADTPAIAAAKASFSAAGGNINPAIGGTVVGAVPSVVATRIAAPVTYTTTRVAVAPATYAVNGGANYATARVPIAGSAIVPAGYAAAGVPIAGASLVPTTYVSATQGLVAHSNGAVVPMEPSDVRAARAQHMAAKY